MKFKVENLSVAAPSTASPAYIYSVLLSKIKIFLNANSCSSLSWLKEFAIKPVKSWSKKIAGNISIFLRKLGLVWHLWMCLDVPYMQKFPASFEGLSSGLIISSAALLFVLALAWSLLTDLSLKHVLLHRVVIFFENRSQEISYTDKCCKRTDLWGNTSSHEHLSWPCRLCLHRPPNWAVW